MKTIFKSILSKSLKSIRSASVKLFSFCNTSAQVYHYSVFFKQWLANVKDLFSRNLIPTFSISSGFFSLRKCVPPKGVFIYVFHCYFSLLGMWKFDLGKLHILGSNRRNKRVTKSLYLHHLQMFEWYLPRSIWFYCTLKLYFFPFDTF